MNTSLLAAWGGGSSLPTWLELESSGRLVGETVGGVCDHISKEDPPLNVQPHVSIPLSPLPRQAWCALCHLPLPSQSRTEPLSSFQAACQVCGLSHTISTSTLFRPRRVVISLSGSYRRWLRELLAPRRPNSSVSEWEEGRERSRRIEMVEPALCGFFFEL